MLCVQPREGILPYLHKSVCDFLERNRLLTLSIIRAHKAQDDGLVKTSTYLLPFSSEWCTFSEPNYLDVYNKAGIILYDANMFSIRQFNIMLCLYWLPNLMDAFCGIQLETALCQRSE